MLKQTPYNTGKVLIGCRYYDTPKLPQMDSEAERLQRALLRDYWIDKDGIWIISGCVLAVIVVWRWVL